MTQQATREQHLFLAAHDDVASAADGEELEYAISAFVAGAFGMADAGDDGWLARQLLYSFVVEKLIEMERTFRADMAAFEESRGDDS